MIFRPWPTALLLTVSFAFCLLSCSKQEEKHSDPQSLLQAIPAADTGKYESIRDMKGWRNPYLIVRSDGVALLDAADNAEIILKNDEVLPALANLPPSNWPYGRVVAAAENGTRVSEQDRIAVRRNKGIVGGILQGANIAVKWVPNG